ncbi:MAG TPA: cyclic nucleotide-binding domain-containing protein [Oligoflexia bacterium]|nr:cyclic nucleotide-binding domain-containing protein [Oligoflexia bacterium]HMP47507.1 cyclic nucleotide-binding domain-containing protein [Oligoflexia bacterium]
MYTIRETSIQLKELQKAEKELRLILMEKFSSVAETVVLPLDKKSAWKRDTLGIITSGALTLEYSDKALFVLENGNILGPWCSDAPFMVEAKGFVCHVMCISTKLLGEKLSGSELLLFQNFHSKLLRTYLSLYAELLDDQRDACPGFKNFDPGELILRKGERGAEVYSIVEGHADVMVDNIKVGSIEPDQLFGVLAALTDLPRSADVIARSPTLVMEFKGDEFDKIIRSRPKLMAKMIEDLAGAIQGLNSRIVELSGGRTDERLSKL